MLAGKTVGEAVREKQESISYLRYYAVEVAAYFTRGGELRWTIEHLIFRCWWILTFGPDNSFLIRLAHVVSSSFFVASYFHICSESNLYSCYWFHDLSRVLCFWELSSIPPDSRSQIASFQRRFVRKVLGTVDQNRISRLPAMRYLPENDIPATQPRQTRRYIRGIKDALRRMTLRLLEEWMWIIQRLYWVST